MINNFFDGVSISIEVFELFKEFCLEKEKKAALRSTFRELAEDYYDEKDSYILLLMSVYYCGLKNGFSDLKFKDELETITQEQIFEFFEEDDALKIYSVLKELLVMTAIPSVKNKIDYSNPGSKNWKAGDLYAYPLSSESIEKAGLSKKYAILYCEKVNKKTNRTNDVKIYVLIGDDKTIKKSPTEILRESVCITSYALSKFYLFLLVSSHHEYPTEKLISLGNCTDFVHPKNEVLPPEDVYIPRLGWTRFNDSISRKYVDFLNKTKDGYLS